MCFEKNLNTVKVMKWARLTQDHRFLQRVHAQYIPSLWGLTHEAVPDSCCGIIEKIPISMWQCNFLLFLYESNAAWVNHPLSSNHYLHKYFFHFHKSQKCWINQ